MTRISPEQQQRRNAVYERVWNCEIPIEVACAELDLSLDYVLALYRNYLHLTGKTGE
jgi:hypothetical protein